MKPKITDDRIRRFVTVENVKTSAEAVKLAGEYVVGSDDPNWLYWDYHISAGTFAIVYIKDRGGK